MPDARQREQWLWGWDPTPGIVSVWANDRGAATVWRRLPDTGELVRETDRFRPWLLYDRLDDLRHLGARLAGHGSDDALVTYRELEGPGALRFLLSARDWATLTDAVLRGASERLGKRLEHVRDLDWKSVLALPPDEQYLVATGRTYFKDLSFQQLRRLQFDLETTGLDAARDRIFLVAVRLPTGETRLLEAPSVDDAGEAALMRELVAVIREADPDVIENHNLHGFDLPFLERRAKRLRVPLALGRIGGPGLRQRGARRGVPAEYDEERRVRFVAPGRELIDTMDAVRRHDQSARDLPSHGLKAVARHFGISGPERELIPGAEIYDTYHTDPDRV
jgi:DNA polymerase III epsilon subunit-like protein